MQRKMVLVNLYLYMPRVFTPSNYEHCDIKQSSIPAVQLQPATLKQKQQTNLPERGFRSRPRQPAYEHLSAFPRSAICAESHGTQESREQWHETLLSNHQKHHCVPR